MRSAYFAFNMMLALVAILSTSHTIIPTCHGFLTPTVRMAATQSHATNIYYPKNSVLRRAKSRASAGAALRMSGEGENGGPEGATDVNSLLEEAKVAQAPIAPPKEVVAAGPMMQPEEEKKKDKETAEMAKPNRGDAWASGAFKRGVALQVNLYLLAVAVCVLYFVCSVQTNFVGDIKVPARVYYSSTVVSIFMCSCSYLRNLCHRRHKFLGG